MKILANFLLKKGLKNIIGFNFVVITIFWNLDALTVGELSNILNKPKYLIKNNTTANSYNSRTFVGEINIEGDNNNVNIGENNSNRIIEESPAFERVLIYVLVVIILILVLILLLVAISRGWISKDSLEWLLKIIQQLRGRK